MNYDFNYKAPPTVAKFMRSDAFFRAIVGPVGSGKSVGCVVEVGRQAMNLATVGGAFAARNCQEHAPTA